jgi:hypothetical protein
MTRSQAPKTEDEDGVLIPAAELPAWRRGVPPTEVYRKARAEGLLEYPMTLEARLAARDPVGGAS